jgi:hypothetical protein
VEPTGQHPTIRELIAELADLEDRIGRLRTRCEPAAAGAPPPGQELLELVRREGQVIAALRRHRPQV